MLAFNQIGNLGRLGNQMFEYAALRGIASHHRYDWCIPPFHMKGIENYSLNDAFNLESVKEENLNVLEDVQYVGERFFHFDDVLFENCPDNVSLHGFFQSEKYFKHIENDIRKDFTFRDEHLKPCKEFIEQFDGKEPIMLHVRRGDPNLVDPRGFKWAYVNCSDQHPVQPLEYYEKALREFNDNQPVIVFSDSPEWVKEQEFFSDDRFMISEPQDKYGDGSYLPYVDLCLMSLCSHAIIANSSMSWWGAWLQTNPNKKVIAPKMWFGPAYSDKDTKDLYCSDWIII
jgi:Glycosyl transferase family 11